MTTDLILTDEQTQIAQQKREAWATMGESVYKAELALQARTQQALEGIVVPMKIEDVPEAESKLAEIKRAQKSITEDRKQITSRFDEVTSRLMLSEKSFDVPIKQLSDGIIVVKKEHENKQRKQQEVIAEQSRIKLHYENEKARIETELQTKVNRFITGYYEKALNDNIEPASLGEFIARCKAAVNDTHFAFSITPFNILHEENKSFIPETDFPNPSSYVRLFNEGLDFKFSDYEVAFNNKEIALKKAKEDEEKEKQRLAEEEESKNMAAKIEAASTPVMVQTTDVKALKKSYEVNMEENVESVLKIMAAFSANLNLCLPKLKVNKWFAFTPNQAATALSKVKCDDNNFAPAGIIFKEVDKL